jgi:glycosyltransferase involved in cell wall biosynthesis
MSTIENIVKPADKKPPLVCFAGCDWWYHNRGLFCPQIIKRLAKDYRVLFVNSLGMRIPSLRKDRNALGKIVRKLRSIFRFLRKSDNGMYVLSPVSIPLASRLGRKLNNYSVFLQVKLISVLLGFTSPVVYIGCPPALEIVKRIKSKRFMIYERTDIFEEMPGINKAYVASLDDELAAAADLVLYVNTALYEKGLSKNKNSLLIGHGVDFDLFSRSFDGENVPEDIAEIKHPIIGFFGDVSDKTSDLKLLEFAAGKMPDMSFVFVGPVSTNVAALREYPNVHFLGQKPYEMIPLYGKEFDVAIMPWNNNKWIQFCNPVKLKEYLALGKPVVSMYYPEITPFKDIVYVATDYEGFVSRILEAVNERDTGIAQKRRDRVRNETWDSKAAQIKNVLNGGRQETKGAISQ